MFVLCLGFTLRNASLSSNTGIDVIYMLNNQAVTLRLTITSLVIGRPGCLNALITWLPEVLRFLRLASANQSACFVVEGYLMTERATITYQTLSIGGDWQSSVIKRTGCRGIDTCKAPFLDHLAAAAANLDQALTAGARAPCVTLP